MLFLDDGFCPPPIAIRWRRALWMVVVLAATLLIMLLLAAAARADAVAQATPAGSVWPTLIQAVATGVGSILALAITLLLPRAISAFEARTGIQLTAQQQATVLAAATTGAGIIQTKLDQGVLRLADIHANDPTILAEAQAAVDRVPEAAEALETSSSAMAAIIVGKVDTSPKALAPAPPPLLNPDAEFGNLARAVAAGKI